jgi:hypothetical protein
MVTIQKILLKHGVFSQDIRIKIKNKQLKLNGELITNPNMELDIEFDEDSKDFKFQDFGNFIFDILMKGERVRDLLHDTWSVVDDIETLAQTNLDNNLVKVFRKVFILRIAKREAIILIRK